MSCPGYSDPRRTHKEARERCGYDNSSPGDCPVGYKYTSNYNPRITIGAASTVSCWSKPERRFYKCYKSEYPDDLETKLDCCSGATSEFDCEPNYCDKESAWGRCRSVFSTYCKKNLNDYRCRRLTNDKVNATPSSKALYDESASVFCTDANMGTPACMDWCKKDGNVEYCRSRLKKFCSDKMDSPEYSGMCACHFPDEKYINIASKIAKGFNVPDGVVDSTPECIFPKCKLSGMPRDIKCNDLSVANCYQNIDINLDKSKVDKLVLNQNVAGCSSTYTRKSTGTGTGTGTGPGTGNDPVPGTDTGDEDRDDPNAPSDDSSWITDENLIILLVFLVIVITMGSALAYYLLSGSDETGVGGESGASGGYYGDIQTIPLTTY
jgi:hypothetical protein